MSTIGEELVQAEEKADKWFEKFRKHTLYFFLGCSLFLNAYLVRREDRKDEQHRADMDKLDDKIIKLEAQAKVAQDRLDYSTDRTIAAQEKSMAIIERYYPHARDSTRGR